MIRMLSLMLAVVGLFLAPAALALEISITNVSSSGGDVNLLQDGDILTVDLTVANPGNVNVFAASLGVSGYDPDADGRAEGLTPIGGSVSSLLFADDVLVVPTAGVFYNDGLANQLTAPEENGTDIFPARELHSLFFKGVDFNAAFGDGSQDPGPDGLPGGIHFQIQFLAEAQVSPVPVQLDLTFGDLPSLGHEVIGDNGSVLSFTDAGLTVFVVPEPGTALLMGLGLAALSVRRR